MKYANMHLHTVYSDGVLTPLELCKKAKEMGYGALSITDHNTVTGHKAFEKAAKETGMDYILGIELYAKADVNFHIVAYDFDPTANGIAEYIRLDEEKWRLTTKAKFDSCINNGIFGGITWQDVLDDAPEECWLCNEQVFASLVKRTEINESDYWWFSNAFSSQKVDVKHNQRVYTAKEVINIINNAGGIASLAHPHNQTQYLPELYSYGLKCVEYDHPDITQEDGRIAYEFAKEHNMYVSGGTDHTGQLANHVNQRGRQPDAIKPVCFLNKDVYCGITKEEFEQLKNRTLG